jgi:signal transduction histidine kinase
MSRIVSGKLKIRIERVDLVAIVTAAVETVLPAARSKRVALQVTTDGPGAIEIEGDADRLQQTVWNLLSNAVKFTAGGGRVDVAVRQIRSGAEVIVKDTGEGIDAAFLPFVFDRFRQADATTTRHHGGLGIGLAIVRYLSEAHGGTVTAHSEGPGRGATFTVRLPRPDGRLHHEIR